MTAITPGWRLLSIGPEAAPVKLRGYELWKQKWSRCTDGRIIVAHPDHPHERHTMTLYRLDCAPDVMFAAGEFSNGVWGFFAPVAADKSNERLEAI